MRKVLLMALLLAVGTAVTATEEETETKLNWGELISELEDDWRNSGPDSSEKIELAEQLASEFPLSSNAWIAGNRTLEEQYALVYLYSICDSEKKGDHKQAANLAAEYMNAVPVPSGARSASVGVLRLQCLGNATREEMVEAARACASAILWGDHQPLGHYSQSWDRCGTTDSYVQLILTTYEKADQLPEAAEFLRLFAVHHAEFADQQGYWDNLVSTYLDVDEPHLAKQAAVTAFRLCPVRKWELMQSLERLYTTLVAIGNTQQAQGFLEYFGSGEGDNPLGQVPNLPLSGQERHLLVSHRQVGGTLSQLVTAHLYSGRYEDALETALQELELLGDRNEAVRMAASDVARCFKAKDMNLHRANQFITFLNTGQSENPLEGF